MRQLVSYEEILKVSPIENADAIETATVRGWEVVVKKGEFSVGEKVVYFEVDSFLPADDPRFEFLIPRGTRTMDDKQGHVLRTIRLRKQISQGLVPPAEQFPELPEIEKWETPVPNGSGDIVGGFPLRWVPKTDSERIQNLGKFLPEILDHEWVCTEKIHGTSTTAVRTDEGELIVASRNWAVNDLDLRYTVLSDLGILDLLPNGWAIQGEIFGEGLLNNTLDIKGHQFRAFSLYNNAKFVPYDEWPPVFVKFRVPILNWDMPQTVEGFVDQVNKMKSTINPKKNAEGVVWHGPKPFTFLGERSTFKSINNEFLLKNGE